MRILKFMQAPEQGANPDLLARLGAIARRGNAEALSYHTDATPLAAPAIQRIFSTPEEIAEEQQRR